MQTHCGSQLELDGLDCAAGGVNEHRRLIPAPGMMTSTAVELLELWGVGMISV